MEFDDEDQKQSPQEQVDFSFEKSTGKKKVRKGTKKKKSHKKTKDFKEGDSINQGENSQGNSQKELKEVSKEKDENQIKEEKKEEIQNEPKIEDNNKDNTEQKENEKKEEEKVKEENKIEENKVEEKKEEIKEEEKIEEKKEEIKQEKPKEEENNDNKKEEKEQKIINEENVEQNNEKEKEKLQEQPKEEKKEEEKKEEEKKEEKKEEKPPVSEGPKKISEYDLINQDPYLKNFEWCIKRRNEHFKNLLHQIESNEKSLENFANSYQNMGLHVLPNGDIKYREYAPGARGIALFGEFNNWNRDQYWAKRDQYGFWELIIPNEDGKPRIKHKTKVKCNVVLSNGQWADRNPIWIEYLYQNTQSLIFDGVFWNPEVKYEWKYPKKHLPRPKSLRIYEAHVGMSSFYPKVTTYKDFTENILPRIKRIYRSSINGNYAPCELCFFWLSCK